MSRSPIDVVRDAYAALEAGDAEALRGLLADDVEWVGPSALMPGGGHHRGRDVVVHTLLEQAAAAFSELRLAPTELLAVGAGRVLAHGRLRAHFKGGDETVTDPFLQLWQVVDGEAVHALLRCDSARILRSRPGDVVGTVG